MKVLVDEEGTILLFIHTSEGLTSVWFGCQSPVSLATIRQLSLLQGREIQALLPLPTAQVLEEPGDKAIGLLPENHLQCGPHPD